MVFDENMKLIQGISGKAGINANPAVFTNVTTTPKTITEPGYVIMFVDNNSIGTDVWFDNVQVSHYSGQVLEENHYYPFGLTISESTNNSSLPVRPYKLTTKELEKALDLNMYDFGARQFDMQLGRWTSVDPLAEKMYNFTPNHFVSNNPINRIDLDGRSDDWVINYTTNEIRWDDNANSRETTSKGKSYLGKELTFVFNSFIDGKYWDGPMGDKPVGDKLTSTITLTARENQAGELVCIVGTKDVEVEKTPVGTARDYYPGEGGRHNVFNVETTKTGIGINFEQHASVSRIEQLGMNIMNYRIVDVAQKLTINYNSNNGKLDVQPFTNIFPSATLNVNGIDIMHYIQPSFKATHTAPTRFEPGAGQVPVFDYYPSKFYPR
jgi:RHS repeat-associated protein